MRDVVEIKEELDIAINSFDTKKIEEISKEIADELYKPIWKFSTKVRQNKSFVRELLSDGIYNSLEIEANVTSINKEPKRFTIEYNNVIFNEKIANLSFTPEKFLNIEEKQAGIKESLIYLIRNLSRKIQESSQIIQEITQSLIEI